jgi:cell division cycle 20-like protein 1 (cofactor of APC complex)
VDPDDPPGGARVGSSSCLVGELQAHKQEVCGLKWSFDERMLASGGNDNKLFVWQPQLGAGNGRQDGPARHSRVETEPICRFVDHCAAVKAVGWSPHQHGTLASGGGTADRHIRFWNALTATPMHRIDTGSQVCNLMWSKNVNEIVSTHGYSLNQVRGSVG